MLYERPGIRHSIRTFVALILLNAPHSVCWRQFPWSRSLYLFTTLTTFFLTVSSSLPCVIMRIVHHVVIAVIWPLFSHLRHLERQFIRHVGCTPLSSSYKLSEVPDAEILQKGTVQ